MDDRQTKIREGAGLEDSRINQEFIDFLNKWSSPVLLTLAIAALVWAGLQYLERKKMARIDQAFSEFESATAGNNPSPASLKTLADEYKGVRSVPELALLETSDLYLRAFVTGYKPGAEINPNTGELINESDLLDDSQRQNYLDQAGDLAQQVLSMTKDAVGKELLAMQAMTRMASVKEGKRDFDGAKSMYQSLESLAKKTEYESVATFAAARLEHIDQLQSVVPLPAKDDLAPLPGEETPTITPEQLQEMMDSIQNEVPQIQSDGAESESAPVEDPETESDADPATEPATEPETGEDSP